MFSTFVIKSDSKNEPSFPGEPKGKLKREIDKKKKKKKKKKKIIFFSKIKK